MVSHPPQPHHQALSRNLKGFRAARGWTLDELARHSGVSRAMIVQVEGARTNPSLGTMCRLADALAVPVHALLAADEVAPIRVLRGDEGTTLWSDRRGSRAGLVSGGSGLTGIELWQWRLGSAASYDADAHPAGTRESLWVHRGRLRVRVGANTVTAGVGDTIQFEANRPHRYENAGKSPCDFSMIVQLPRREPLSATRTPMRLAVLSDIHGNLVALEAVLAHLRTQAPDVIVNLGDCVTSPLWPKETLELLESLGFPTVRGNHDRRIAEPDPGRLAGSMRSTHDALTAEQRRRLGALPPALEITGDVLAVHGTPRDDCEYLLEESIGDRLCRRTTEAVTDLLGASRHTLVLCGHSHQQHAAWAQGGRLVLNPGSVGAPRYADNAQPAANEAGSPHARYAIVDGRGGRWSVQMYALDYDWSSVVDRAKSAGRPDWAAGFLKGREVS